MKTQFGDDHMLGQAGVYRVSSELLLRGVETFFPSVDMGCDLRTPDFGVQVKSANLSQDSKYPENLYYWYRLDKGRKRVAVRHPDFHVLWGRDEDRFWVVPSATLAGKKMCAVANIRSNNRKSKLSQWEGKWDSLSGEPASQHLLDGEAGCQRVISELLLRGVNPSRPVVDTGVDLCVGGIRIQVKSAHLAKHEEKWDALVYAFNTNTHLGRSDSKERRDIVYSDSVDIFVFWGIEQNRFWIVPAQAIDGVNRLYFTGDETRHYADGTTGIAKLREYENRWDLICGDPAVLETPAGVDPQPIPGFEQWLAKEGEPSAPDVRMKFTGFTESQPLEDPPEFGKLQ